MGICHRNNFYTAYNAYNAYNVALLPFSRPSRCSSERQKLITESRISVRSKYANTLAVNSTDSFRFGRMKRDALFRDAMRRHDVITR